MMRAFDAATLKAILLEGIASLDVQVSETQADTMIAYLSLLSKWNSVYNLTAIRDPQEMVRQHVLDCLAAAPAFAASKNVLDVGAGGGLPGMILAIAYPALQVSMIDTVSKKTAFLTQAKTELGLSNVTVHTGRVEALQSPGGYDTITSRAFSELSNFVNWSGHLLAEGGRFIAMKGVQPDQEIEKLPPGWRVEQIEPLSVPGLQVERHLVFIRKTPV